MNALASSGYEHQFLNHPPQYMLAGAIGLVMQMTDFTDKGNASSNVPLMCKLLLQPQEGEATL